MKKMPNDVAALAARVTALEVKTDAQAAQIAAMQAQVDLCCEPPEWVPVGALIHIDFVSVRAWSATAGQVGIDVLVGHDSDAVNGWGANEYNTSNLTADGYTCPVPTPALAFLGEAKSKLLDGATIRVRIKCLAAGGFASIIGMSSADGNDAVEAQTIPSVGQIFSWNGPANAETAAVVNSGVGVVNVSAATFTATRLEMAVNGSAPIAVTLTTSDRPPGNPLVAAVLDSQGNDQGISVQAITIYDALPDASGLVALAT